MSVNEPSPESKDASGAERLDPVFQETEGSSKETAEAAYRERLELLWSIAHGDEEDVAGEFELYVEAMVAAGVALPTSVVLQAGGLGGDATTVRILVSDLVRQAADPPALERILRATLPPPIDRLGRRGRSTPEERADIVGTALFPLRRYPAAGALALALVGHLHLQPPDQRGPGWFASVANMGTIVTGVRERDQSTAGVAVFHLVLFGVGELARAADGNALEGNSRQAVTNAAHNAAAAIADMLQRGRETRPSAEASTVLRDLKSISAATAREPTIDEAAATAVLSALGMPPGAAVDVVTVLADMGAVAGAWQDDVVGQARLEASSGTVDAVTTSPRDPAGRLFNAGVSLGRSADRSTVGFLRCRMLLYALGLRLSLGPEAELIPGLVERSGLDCAVNLSAAYNDYRNVVGQDDPARPVVLALVTDLVSLGSWPSLAGRAPAVDLARLRASGSELGIEPGRRTNAPALIAPIGAAIDALRTVLEGPPSHEDPVLDTARLVGFLFTAALSPLPEPSEPSLVEQVRAVSRQDPAAALIEHYARYAPTPDDPIGTGPLVPLGMVTRAEWDALVRRITTPQPNLVALLRDFTLGSRG